MEIGGGGYALFEGAAIILHQPLARLGTLREDERILQLGGMGRPPALELSAPPPASPPLFRSSQGATSEVLF